VVDVYIQPSHVPTCGRSLLAAMASGIPCIAAEVEGPRQLLDSGTRGLLVPPRDPSALALAMISLLDRPLLSRSLADLARSWASTHLDPEREADALADLYDDAVRASSRATRPS
jgi:glycosyltransferase involved in cell wall biosynthesis